MMAWKMRTTVCFFYLAAGFCRTVLGVPEVGGELPSIKVFEGTPENAIDLKELFGMKRGILFGVPGAFTPGCSKTHLPSYLAEYKHLKAAGVEVIACVAVNDPYVMAGWGEASRAGGKIRMLADPHAELTRALGLQVDAPPLGPGVRSKRYSLIVDKGKIVTVNLEPDGFGLTNSLAGPALFDALGYTGHIKDEL
mmetsp:Transcript_15782/g.26633  ORF Transcript_15782/g.26633 Transcript_15782/m.26633 type:complete len:195 (-) Transcript_15782:163-747(-)